MALQCRWLKMTLRWVNEDPEFRGPYDLLWEGKIWSVVSYWHQVRPYGVEPLFHFGYVPCFNGSRSVVGSDE